MTAVFKREFRSFFTSPVGYVVLAVLGSRVLLFGQNRSPFPPAMISAVIFMICFLH